MLLYQTQLHAVPLAEHTAELIVLAVSTICGGMSASSVSRTNLQGDSILPLLRPCLFCLLSVIRNPWQKGDANAVLARAAELGSCQISNCPFLSLQ